MANTDVITPTLGLAPAASEPGARFTPAMEAQFQNSYYAHIRPTLRVTALFLFALFAFYVARDWNDTHSTRVALSTAAPLAFFALVAGLTWAPFFARCWKWFVVGGGLLTAWIALNGQAEFLAQTRLRGGAMGSDFGMVSLFFGQQMRVLMVCLIIMRLPFKPALALQLLLLTVGLSEFAAHILGGPLSLEQVIDFLKFTAPFMAALLLGSWVEERLSRRAFEANYHLAQLQAEEHQRLVETQSMLHVLGQSIGGIVHDLGNPLTTVQTGAQTLDLCLESNATDPEILREITAAIHSGAQMLNFLRLSLIEQTRVLEGAPTPVELKPVAVRTGVELGARFQKPNFAFKRSISLHGEDAFICADAMKIATVWMNLIGNALKYSDGAVRVHWRPCEGESLLLIAVCDEGTRGRGLTREAAAQLFTAFGRLEIHQAIEGTGLGLLSIRNIVAAHGGESWIEGYNDGTPHSSPFSTGPQEYPAMLTEEFRTAFVVSCPIAKQ